MRKQYKRNVQRAIRQIKKSIDIVGKIPFILLLLYMALIAVDFFTQKDSYIVGAMDYKTHIFIEDLKINFKNLVDIFSIEYYIKKIDGKIEKSENYNAPIFIKMNIGTNIKVTVKRANGAIEYY